MSFITFLKIVILASPQILKNLVLTESEPKIRNMYKITIFDFLPDLAEIMQKRIRVYLTPIAPTVGAKNGPFKSVSG